LIAVTAKVTVCVAVCADASADETPIVSASTGAKTDALIFNSKWYPVAANTKDREPTIPEIEQSHSF
jgi:hypothetical protein